MIDYFKYMTEAKTYADSLDECKVEPKIWIRAYSQKFAELIVRECADVACKHMELNEGVDYNVGEKIKQHFGVKE
jgi:hypothetical protein